MDINRILQTRANRQSRLGRPFAVFCEAFFDCHGAAKSLVDGVESEFPKLLERSVVITMTTAIEVYYKDILDGIFRLCSPSFYEPQLKSIHSAKYDIVDLVELYRKQVHPLELIAANQSFQNIDAIESVFSRFLGRSLWRAVIGTEVRIKEEPERVGKFSHEDLTALESLFALRHELVHYPGQHGFLNAQTVHTVVRAAWMVFGSDIVLMQMISDHLDAAIEDAASK